MTTRMNSETTSMPRPTGRLLSAVIAALALLLAGCGSESEGSTSADDAEITSTEGSGEGTSNDADDEADTNADTTSGTDVDVAGNGTAVDLFMDGALANDIVTVDCVLADGTESTCYQITVVGAPVDVEIGPFCPTTIDDTADDVGIWLDGEDLYDIDGQFIVDLPEIYNDDNWQLHDEDGHVHVTDTQEAFEGAARPDVAEEYQNHCVEGQIAWLEGGEPIATTIEIPASPTAGDSTTQAGDELGVTLNGVIIAGEAPISAILGAYTIAAFDDCGGHINPFDGYHLHGATGCSEVGEASDGETPPFAIAADGYTIHSPLEDNAAADLDECNGHTTDELGYHYHANSPELNAVLSCFTGKTTEAAVAGNRPRG